MSIHGFSHPGSSPSDPPLADGDLPPDWEVISFIDPAGTGKDFAFTQGLDAFQLPELLLWARPTEGFDPGADWLLTHRERIRLLNCWAVELLTGRLTYGTERDEEFDGGQAVAHFRFGRPAVTSQLYHPHLPPQTYVLSVTWSLLRGRPGSPESLPEPLAPAAERRMQRWITRAEETTRAWRLRCTETLAAAGPGQLAALSIGGPSWGRFGPMTPWVDARIAQVLAAGPDVVAEFLNRLHFAGHVRCEDCLVEELTRLATRSHRNSACREASQAAQELALMVIGWPSSVSPVWDIAMTDAFHPRKRPDHTLAQEEVLKVVLTEGLEVLLLSAVLADQAGSALIADTTGPWEWAVSDRRLPGRQWLAPPSVRQAARDLLAPATPDQLVRAVAAPRPAGASIERHQVTELVLGLQTTSAASAQPGRLFHREQRSGLPRLIVRSADQLAGQLLTAMAQPHQFSSENWELIRESLSPLVPDLPAQRPPKVS